MLIEENSESECFFSKEMTLWFELACVESISGLIFLLFLNHNKRSLLKTRQKIGLRGLFQSLKLCKGKR